MKVFTIETLLKKNIDEIFKIITKNCFYEKIGNLMDNSTYVAKYSNYDEINKKFSIKAEVKTVMALDNILKKLINENLIFERSDSWTMEAKDKIHGAIEYSFEKPLSINVCQEIIEISKNQTKIVRVYSINYAFPILKNKIESFVENSIKSSCEEELKHFKNFIEV